MITIKAPPVLNYPLRKYLFKKNLLAELINPMQMLSLFLMTSFKMISGQYARSQDYG